MLTTSTLFCGFEKCCVAFVKLSIVLCNSISFVLLLLAGKFSFLFFLLFYVFLHLWAIAARSHSVMVTGRTFSFAFVKIVNFKNYSPLSTSYSS